MKLEAKFEVSSSLVALALDNLNKQLESPVGLLVREVFVSGKAYVDVIGKNHEVMMLIGEIANLGESGLIYVISAGPV